MATKHENLPVSENNPESLVEICIETIARNLDAISIRDPVTLLRRLKHDIILPVELCEKFIDIFQRKHVIDDKIANIFRDTERTKINNLKLRNSAVTVEGLLSFMVHKPKTVELIHCVDLTQVAINVINDHSENLVSLKFGPLCYTISQNRLYQKEYILSIPQLRKLSIQCRRATVFPILLTQPLYCLRHLELSELTQSNYLTALQGLETLESLVLYNVRIETGLVEWICTLHSLKHLDLSQSNERLGVFPNPNLMLSRMMHCLPHLMSLDISGTNLAGTGAAPPPVEEVGVSEVPAVPVRCDIPGLVSRVNNPLHFLGLYGTHNGACRWHDIPAKVITGDTNEEQILTSAKVYMGRPAMLAHVLNDLYYLFRYDQCESVQRSLAVVLEAMRRHIPEKHIQISGSATLFYIVKGKEKDKLGMKLKRNILNALLDAMEEHRKDETVMRNGCITICQFKIPADVLCEYERLVQMLLSCVPYLSQEGFVQRVSIYLLNSLACQVDGNRKLFLGKSGLIEKMVHLISARHECSICDDVLEVAWSTLWNVTDETPANSSRFLECHGMELFIACLETFPQKEELLRNMMGLLGNVAEVAELRPQLMDTEFLDVFYDLLDSSSDGIEVSYNAAGVLAHIASDGEEAWVVANPPRAAVLARLAMAVQTWNLRDERNINYRSFKPILGLLSVYHTPQCQHWAVWALANLTTVYPQKYCSLVIAEDGISLLKKIIKDPRPYTVIKDLACMVINNCSRYTAQDTDNPPPDPVSYDN
ncbi:protein zer-1 homolog [Papilio machaon]|uniref:protein zer-1 homolog n=1 Tax=Papilio machaon TaxID=76193 RepID=UPI001E6636C9|nr:protein zer-1 homolog [Papilio machaon]